MIAQQLRRAAHLRDHDDIIRRIDRALQIIDGRGTVVTNAFVLYVFRKNTFSDQTAHAQFHTWQLIVISAQQQYLFICLWIQRKHHVIILDHGHGIRGNFSLQITVEIRADLLIGVGQFFFPCSRIRCVIEDAALFFQRQDTLD